MIWTPCRDCILVRERALGFTPSELAKRLGGTTPDKVRARLKQLGVHGVITVTEAEDLLAEIYGEPERPKRTSKRSKKAREWIDA